MVKPSENFNKEEQRILTVWAADCAERVLHYFEAVYSDDARPRAAIAAARRWVAVGVPFLEIRKISLAAHAAARAADDPAAVAAARAAGHAIATGHVATHARASSRYAIKAVLAAAPDMAEAEKAWQDGQLPDHIRRKLFPDQPDG